ncbi:hypothetical protein ABW19_dt0204215 [Dactylella cylindrospora]|nr:hypothetical protein ABW19_dt0204215 [Dactylella cylindrospora]
MHPGEYRSGSSSSGITTPESRPSYSYPNQHHYQQRSRNYEPRMAGSSTRRGGFYSTEDMLRSAKSHNAELNCEYQRFRPMPISNNGYLEVPPEFPENAHDLSLMDPREIQDLCSLYRIDSGGSRMENIIAFLKHIGASHLARSFLERDNYGSDF